MTPNMAPYIALAWSLSAIGLFGITAWTLWRYQKRGR